MAMKEKQGTPNPYIAANCLSKLTYWWLLDIFRLGKNNNLREDNLYDVLPENVSKDLGDQLEKLWENELMKAKKSRRKPSLWRAIRQMVIWQLILQGISSITSNLCKLIQPLLLAKLILFFNPTSTLTLEEAYTYSTGLMVVTILQMVITRHQLASQYTTGMQVKIACSSLLYRKVLKLSSAFNGATVNGLIINLMSNDLAKLEKFFIFFPFLWLMPLLMLLMTYLLWRQLGLAAFAGIFLMMTQIVPTQVIWYQVASKLRVKSAARIDKRVLLIGEIINGIKVIKMYAWEKYFEKLVHRARKREVQTLLQLAYIRSTSLAMSVFSDRIALFCTIAAYVWLGNVVAADKIFSTVHYFVLMRQVAGRLFPEAVSYGSATTVAMKRMEDFLNRPEIESEDNTTNSNDNIAVAIKQVDATWGDSNANHICSMNLNIVQEKLYAIVGPVGSGKSSLLKLILGELPPMSGEVSIHGKVSYASQDPWLFGGSVRDNILFGEEYREDRYNQVVRVCQLLRDFDQLPFGDRTLVGERGMSLSGGQCARVNLARAVYRDADVYLFDDPLSAVDSHVSRRLFEDCINDFLKLKTRVLVTHQVQYLQQTDAIVVLNDGQIEFEGCYKSFIANEKYLENLSASNEQEEQETERRNEKNLQSSVSIQKEETSKNTEPQETKESVGKAQNNMVSYLKYIKAGGSYISFILIMLLFVVTQMLISGFEYWWSFWTKQEDERLDKLSETNATDSAMSTVVADESMSSETALAVSGGLVIAIIILSNLKNFWFFARSLRSSKAIHNQMFSRLLKAPLQFFNVNPSGRMLNRFSKDTAIVDDGIPNAVIEVLEWGLNIAGVLIQIIVISWWTAVPMLILGFIIIKMNQIYLTTAQALKRLEGNAKSPVFSLINSTLLGLPTIRSCRAQNIVSRKFDKCQDANTAAQLLIHMTSLAYGMWIDILTLIFMAFMIYSFIPLRSAGMMGGDVGLALTQFFSICLILELVSRQFCEVVAQMTSIERMLEYTRLEQEGPFETELDKIHDESWPSRGEIIFENLNLRYSEGEQPVLKDLSFTIKPSMKVGVVGRTGAGKSSLVAALFRLAKFDGSLRIDDTDAKDVGLLRLRSKISIIPQEPTLFTGPLRANLDPLGQFDDAALWSALRDVEMHRVFDSLDEPIDGNLSSGQSQLLCLARAIVRKNRILVLDEATASVDLLTDELIQRTIRCKFGDCTVLTIAHRLNTVMDSDAILVMDAGRVAEFDRPHCLLQKNNGYFSKIVEESGNAANLKNIVIKASRVSADRQTTRLDFTNERDEISRL